MTIEAAVFAIIGDEAGHAIIADKSIHWAVVAAMTAANSSHDPKAISTIRQWNVEQKRGLHS